MALRMLSYLVISAILCTQVSAVVFTFDCATVPDVCNTHCFASHCGAIDYDVTGFHRDLLSGTRQPKPGSTTTSATFRRQAIGCVNNNPCAGGSTCDEIPYASTSNIIAMTVASCFPQGYAGNPDLLFQQGAIHCVPLTQNAAHGALLGQFYAHQNIPDSGLL
ncbi:hypothetical protein BDZ94DRAFT_1241510 [Collybia nuda]|uniref:Deoxyribonuclease NucA/NucB domain-containing protein n=1 Tax=Collybia nuda TaxID=64659 RepID=A0A9P6C8X0_9AGAR|nr:hypothetical protein BDZ94DRAFT_1241510 [Collybia nuda]